MASRQAQQLILIENRKGAGCRAGLRPTANERTDLVASSLDVLVVVDLASLATGDLEARPVPGTSALGTAVDSDTLSAVGHSNGVGAEGDALGCGE